MLTENLRTKNADDKKRITFTNIFEFLKMR